MLVSAFAVFYSPIDWDALPVYNKLGIKTKGD